MQYNQQPREEHPPHAGEQRIERWRNQAREQLRKEQEQATGRMRRLKTRIEPLKSDTGPIIPQPNAVTPWHGCGDDATLDIFETPTYEMKAITLPKTSAEKTRARNHASDIAPEEESVHVMGGKWHYDSPKHGPNKMTLNNVVECYLAQFGAYPKALEASESLCGTLMLQQVLHIYNGDAFYLYVNERGQVHPVRIQQNFWSPFWCISAHIPSTNH